MISHASVSFPVRCRSTSLLNSSLGSSLALCTQVREANSVPSFRATLRVCGPQTCDQLREKFRMVGDHCHYLVRAADGSSVASFQQRKDVSSRH
jgi:hypothetical protein